MIALPQLHEFVTANREEIITRCRAKVATRSMPPPTAAEIDHGVPLFLDQLVDALRAGDGSSEAIGRSAVMHGHELLVKGFTVSQVVHDYGDVCQSITELAVELAAPIDTEDFRTLNGCLDDAIAMAVTQYAHERDQSNSDGEALRESERLGYFAHELRNMLNMALLAFDAIKSGNVGVAGSTSHVLHRSLMDAEALVNRTLADVRVARGMHRVLPIALSELMAEIEPGARLAADARYITLTVEPAEAGIFVRADRQVLVAVIMNLLQNAYKFTRPRSAVTLRVGASADRVLIEVEDECGGLPPGDNEELFRPFEQRGANRSGAGLGLAFSRSGIEANHGRVYARNLPNVGCVFTIDLPRLTSFAVPA